jgi:hypothetical protein
MFYNCYSLQSVPLLDVTGVSIYASTFLNCRSLQKATLDKPRVSLSYLNCRLAEAEIVDIFNNLYDFRDVITIDVSPATDWAADDVITGQTSGAVCTVVSKIDATNYIVKSRGATAFQVDEIIGAPGKLADQGAAHPTFSAIEHLALDVAPATAWVAGETITGQTSANTCIVVEQFSTLLYSVKSRSGAFNLDEIVGVTGTPAKLANQGAANPIFYGRGAIAGVTAPTITITGNWGAAGLDAADNLLATNKGWTIAA